MPCAICCEIAQRAALDIAGDLLTWLDNRHFGEARFQDDQQELAQRIEDLDPELLRGIEMERHALARQIAGR